MTKLQTQLKPSSPELRSSGGKNLGLAHFLALLFLFLLPARAFPVAQYNSLDIYPGLVANPLVYSYDMCKAKYGYCSCRLTNLTNADEVVQRFDQNGDQILQFNEVEAAIQGGVLLKKHTENSEYLACYYDPPKPGPYSQENCYSFFGDKDCVCAERFPQGSLCYSRSATEQATKPVYVPREYCQPFHPDGFECRCGLPQGETLVPTPTDAPCMVVTQEEDVDYSCFDEIRIFSGEGRKCVAKRSVGGVAKITGSKCCPNQLPCELQEYDSGALINWWDLANYGLYIALVYIWNQHRLQEQGIITDITEELARASDVLTVGQIGHVMTKISLTPTETILFTMQGPKVLTDKDKFMATVFRTYLENFKATSPIVAGLYTIYSYAEMARMAYSTLIRMLEMLGIIGCKPEDYQLACRVRSRLCLYVGDYTSTKFFVSTTYQRWMCFSSQIARVINEYGLPQLYDPGCHRENCDAASVAPNREVHPTNCGCEKAYAKEGKVRKGTRHKGFTVDQFQRLDFDQIPIAAELAKVLMGGNESYMQKEVVSNTEMAMEWEDKLSPIREPSALDLATARASTQDVTPKGSEDNPSVAKLGSCPGSFPATTAETFTPSEEFIPMVCTKLPMESLPPEKHLPARKNFIYVLLPQANCVQCDLEGRLFSCDFTGDSIPDCGDFVHISVCKKHFQEKDPGHVPPPGIDTFYSYFLRAVDVSSYIDCIHPDYLARSFYGPNPPIFKYPDAPPLAYYPFVERTPSTPDLVNTIQLNAKDYKNAGVSFLGVFNYSLSTDGIHRAMRLERGSCFIPEVFIPSPEDYCSKDECSMLVVGHTSGVSDRCREYYNDLASVLFARLEVKDGRCRWVPIEGETSEGTGNEFFRWFQLRSINTGFFTKHAQYGVPELREGIEYFCHCPSYERDVCIARYGLRDASGNPVRDIKGREVKLPEMVCPRPSVVNLMQKSIYNFGSGGYAAYRSNPAYDDFYCWLDPETESPRCDCNRYWGDL